jgi:hypothetical protein
MSGEADRGVFDILAPGAEEDAGMRAGQMICACPASSPRAGEAAGRWTLTACFGLAVLAQALALTVLPEQSRLLAPTLARVGWPFALLLVGAALASFPAALLIDAFGRRAAFALGASLGAAGGALAAFSIAKGNFFGLCLGAFWLGLAQGFALFYRHVAAQGAPRDGLLVLAGGAGAALATPGFIWLAATPAMALMTAAGLHIAALALAVRMPHVVARPAEDGAARLSRDFILATVAGACAWALMSAAMLHGPLTLAVCAATPAFIGGAMGWHLIAMYAPAAVAARWPAAFPPLRSLFAALGVMGAGVYVIGAGASVASVTAGLVGVGLGWGVVNVAALRLLHAEKPARAALALHDLCLLGAAAAGALL